MRIGWAALAVVDAIGACALLWLVKSDAPPARAAIPAQAPAELVEVHYGPEENLERIDVGLIDSAKSSIDMDAYVLTDWTVGRALCAAAGREIKVRIWRDANGVFGAEPDCANNGGRLEERYKEPGALMHLKSYCVDGATLRTGSANFSHSGETRQDNDLVIIRSPEACAGFEVKFEKAWGEK